MAYTTAEASQQVVANQHVTVLELVDRLLDKGVVVKGEVLLSVADIDLVYLNLGLLLSSVKTVEEAAMKGGKRDARFLAWQASTQAAFEDEPQIEETAAPATPATPLPAPDSESSDEEIIASMVAAIEETTAPSTPLPVLESESGDEEQFSGPRANIDPNNVEKGLTQLVLTVVELLRKLMEKQAVRRIDAGQLGADEIERVGTAFMLLDERMEQLKQVFGLEDENLNLNLGPLGDLL